MKIAVTGGNGRLGSELVRRGCIPIWANVTDLMSLGKAIREINPQVVIHCAAYTNVDQCENAVTKAATVNTGGTFGLGQVFLGKIVYISTDYVFNGRFGPYHELSSPNPISIYGWSKLGGEIAIRNRKNPADLIVRTTVLFDRHSDNFVTTVIERLKNGEVLSLPSNLFGSPTYVPSLASGILSAIEQDLNGVLNIAGSVVISRLELGRYIARQLGIPEEQIQPGPVMGQAPRPLQAGLVIEKARLLDIPITDPSEDIGEMIDALEKMEAG